MAKSMPPDASCSSVVETENTYAYQRQLSPCEAQVCHWLLAGKSLPEVAIILGKGTATVKQQTLSIYRKLGVASRPQLFAKYMNDSKSPAFDNPGEYQEPAVWDLQQ
ncbi:helix-turn-helix transcriptional regulator [Massilia sp. MB5]|uniref:helix-turn-helix transcriptional regulator n=1 Tax=Massilia sp. MB5 TaxID=2919578 RepID=UPI0009E52072|nr:helix-turn-helix transcriptional regulator [Massilia sp. MB5]UMR32898.1 helix-turn-helix transcriptional regulator [Massilia sp. MB5]